MAPKNLENKIKQAEEVAEIREIVEACKDFIYRGEGTVEKGRFLLSEIIGVFPSKLFKEIPELEAVFQKLENGKVRIK